MSIATPAVPGGPAVVDGVDVDAVAAAVRSCPAVLDLRAGRPDHTATYLPGRRVEGVRVDRDAVVVQVRARWGFAVPELAAQVRRVLAPLVAGRRVDVVVADLGPTAPSENELTGGPAAWTTPPASGARSGARSSASTIPTPVATPPPSSPV